MRSLIGGGTEEWSNRVKGAVKYWFPVRLGEFPFTLAITLGMVWGGMSLHYTFSIKKLQTSRDINWGSLSEWMDDGQPNNEKSFLKQKVTVKVDMSEQGKAKGNPEYSSTATRRSLFFEHEGLGPTKSTDTLSKGCMEWISLAGGGL